MNLSLPCPRCSQSGGTGKVIRHELVIDRENRSLDSPGVIMDETPGSFWWCDECHTVFPTRCESPVVLQSPEAGPSLEWDVDEQVWKPVTDDWTL